MARNSVSEWSSTADSNTDVAGINIAEQCAPSGINNAIRAIMAQVASYIGGGIATLLDLAQMTSNTKIVTPKAIADAVVPQTLSDGATIALDLGTGAVFTLTKTQNGAMTITNGIIGRTYQVFITQDATGGRTLSKPTVSGSTVKVRGDWTGLSITGGAVDLLNITRVTSTLYLITPAKGYI